MLIWKSLRVRTARARKRRLVAGNRTAGLTCNGCGLWRQLGCFPPLDLTAGQGLSLLLLNVQRIVENQYLATELGTRAS